MTETSPASPPTLVWLRRDLRLSDHPALHAAAADGPVIPVFILDPETEALGAAHRWRLERSLADLASRLEGAGSRLVLRRGPALEVLRALVAETGARAVHWSRLHDRAARARDEGVKAALKADGIAARSFNGLLAVEPWEVETKTGGFYKVYTPFWKAVRGTLPPEPLPAPRLRAPVDWPGSERLADLGLGRDVRRGAAALCAHAVVGEEAARARLDGFLAQKAARYPEDRDRLDRAGTSGLSENLAVGEISARTVWHAARGAMERGVAGAEGFLQEIVWREFAYHLLHHTPRIEDANWREAWDAFPWREDNADAERWRRAETGIEVIDAAMRELWVTGRMHNRARMLVASFLTKNLRTHWRVGERWFADCLTDWDPASNAMGWQWAAGSGPDAAPFFRIFNPDTQGEKFDPARRYRAAWLPETAAARDADAPGLAWFDATPRAWDQRPDRPRPSPMVDLKESRAKALSTYHDMRQSAHDDAAA